MGGGGALVGRSPRPDLEPRGCKGRRYLSGRTRPVERSESPVAGEKKRQAVGSLGVSRKTRWDTSEALASRSMLRYNISCIERRKDPGPGLSQETGPISLNHNVICPGDGEMFPTCSPQPTGKFLRRIPVNPSERNSAAFSFSLSAATPVRTTNTVPSTWQGSR